MSDAEGGVHKHTKHPVEASTRSSGWATATHLHAAVKSKLTRLGIPVAGAGGLGAFVTADAHQMNTATAVASASVFGATVVATLTVRLVERYYEAQPKIMEARAKADEVKIKAEEAKASLEMQRTLLEKFADDSTKAPHIERLFMRLMRQRLAARALELGASPEQIRALGTLLVDDQPGNRSEQNDEGGELRALGGR